MKFRNCWGLLALALALPGHAGDNGASGRLVRDGVAIDFSARAVDGGALTEAGMAELRFAVSDAASGAPIAGLTPGAWLDLAQAGGDERACKDKIALYLKGLVGVRPLLDLNGYHLVILNKDPSLTIIDPVISVAGKTSTYGTVVLKKPGIDWAKSSDGKRLYVSMPRAGQVAVIDAERFKRVSDIDAGDAPTRLALQPDGRYLWVGNNTAGGAGGVTVIDTQTLQPVFAAATGRGHHEIAFSDDSRHAFVSNRDEGTVSIFDIAKLELEKTLGTGRRPISLAWSAFAEALYVADGEDGTISVIDGRTLAPRKRLTARPGLGPLRFTPDGRYALVLNPQAGTATPIDAASDRLLPPIAVTAEPYQIAFTRGFAYIRGLASEHVSMLNLGSLGEGKTPIVQSFAAGQEAPRRAGELPLADSLAPAGSDAGVFVVNPVDNTVYFYMEGMNAPMTGYPNRGHTARAATVVDRALRQVEPGVFVTQARLPVAGRYEVAFLLDRPRVLHCFHAEVKADPGLEKQYAKPQARFELQARQVAAHTPVPLRVRLSEGRAASPRTGVADLRIRYFRAPASPPKEVAARELGDGLYEALVEFDSPGAYYLHVGAASLRLGFNDQPYVSLRVGEASQENFK